jgi:alkylation response protein AidB-like acyl-CoA dehydrogenase
VEGSSSSDLSNEQLLHYPVTHFTEDEQMARQAARQWAVQELKPVVRQMDNDGKIMPEILQQLFAHGFMGMEIPESLGGAGMSFTSACLVGKND